MSWNDDDLCDAVVGDDATTRDARLPSHIIAMHIGISLQTPTKHREKRSLAIQSPSTSFNRSRHLVGWRLSSNPPNGGAQLRVFSHVFVLVVLVDRTKDTYINVNQGKKLL